MQSILKGLVVVVFVVSVMTFGVSLMVGYSGRDLAKQAAAKKQEVAAAEKKKKELSEARQGAPESEQGIEYWEAEWKKSANSNKTKDEKLYPELMQNLTAAYAQDRSKFDKSEEENIKTGERILAEKQRGLKELRVKVQQARVEHDKAMADIKELENQKKELLNRTAQEKLLLDDVRDRHQEVGKQLEAAKSAVGGN
jgi:hypothetical protein